MLESWCSLESTQYKRWFSKSWGGEKERGSGLKFGTPTRISACLSPLPYPYLWAQPQTEASLGRTVRKDRHWHYRRGKETRPLDSPPVQGRQGSPRVIPLGHSMLSDTSVCRSAPLSPDFSILAWYPQSDQYMNLKERRTQLCLLSGFKVRAACVMALNDPLNVEDDAWWELGREGL